MAATKFFLPSSGAAAVSPTPNTGWEVTTGFDRLAMVTTRGTTAFTDKISGNPDLSGSGDALVRQYVSDIFPAQTIGGTVKGQVRGLESSASMDARAQFTLYAFSTDGSTLLATLVDFDTGGLSSEFATALTNRAFPRGGAAAVSATISQDFRIVAEYGCRKHGTSFSGQTVSLNFGDNSATALPEDETTTAANHPWLEFSADLANPPVAEGGLSWFF